MPRSRRERSSTFEHETNESVPSCYTSQFSDWTLERGDGPPAEKPASCRQQETLIRPQPPPLDDRKFCPPPQAWHRHLLNRVNTALFDSCQVPISVCSNPQ